MKKTIIILATALAAFTFASCEKSEVETTGKNIKVNITVASPEGPDTKAVKTAWAVGDKINIWFDEYMTAEPNMVLTYNGTKWDASALAEGIDLKESGYIKALYEGYNDWSKYVKYDRTDWDNYQNYFIDGPDYHYPVSCYTSAYTDPATYTYDGETLTGAISEWYIASCIQVVITGAPKASANYQLKCSNLIGLGGFNIYKDVISQSATGTNRYAGGVDNADGVAFYYSMISNAAVGVASDYTFTLLDSSDNTQKTYTVTGKTMTYDESKLQGIKIAYSNFE